MITGALVRDNGEGDDFPHGPYGNLHVLLLDARTPSPAWDDFKCNDDIIRWTEGHLLGHFQLRGGWWTGDKWEWADGECVNYQNLGLYQYTGPRGGRPRLKIFVYESDQGPAGCAGRHHDPLLWGIIDGNVIDYGYFLLESPYAVHDDVAEKFPAYAGKSAITLSLAITTPPPPPPPACLPSLIAPADGVALDNGCIQGEDQLVWDFDWADCKGASEYRIFVYNELPLPDAGTIDIKGLTSSSYRYRKQYLGLLYLAGWKWRVQSKVNGSWGEWSAERSFTVKPPRLRC